MTLTARQREILGYMERFADDHGYPPTVREIGRAIGLTSTSTVHAHLRNLERSGHLRRDPTKPRAVEMLDGRARRGDRPGRPGRPARAPTLPLVGRVAAGAPILAEENVEDEIAVPHVLAPAEDGFVLQVRGDSMIGAGILDGDYVVVTPQKVAHDGEIVVALLEDEATVKRFFRESDHVRLQPENPALEPIRSRDVQVVGRVTGVLRKM